MMGLFVEVQYRGDWWGEDPLTETEFETTGDLFRALSGRDPAHRYMALGRCTGKVYVDVKDSPCELCEQAPEYHLHVRTAAECAAIVIDGTAGHCSAPQDHHRYQPKARQVGWVFEARNPEPVNRGDPEETGLRVAWVTVYTAPPTVVRTDHPAEFK